jgi:hypothetical protein
MLKAAESCLFAPDEGLGGAGIRLGQLLPGKLFDRGTTGAEEAWRQILN